MSAVLLANAAATLFMTGLIWLVQLVHYPLFAEVGEHEFGRFHAEHTDRITPLVLPVMAVELVTSLLLVLDRPVGVSAAGVWVGLALAAGLWLSTLLLQAPVHRGLGRGSTPARVRRLVTLNWTRTAAWTARSGLVLGMLAAVA